MPKYDCDGKNISVYRSGRGREMLMNHNNFSGDIRNSPGFDEPNMLSVIMPVVFDQVGINLCRFIPFTEEMLGYNPAVESVILEVIDIDFTHEGFLQEQL